MQMEFICNYDFALISFIPYIVSSYNFHFFLIVFNIKNYAHHETIADIKY